MPGTTCDIAHEGWMRRGAQRWSTAPKERLDARLSRSRSSRSNVPGDPARSRRNAKLPRAFAVSRRSNSEPRSETKGRRRTRRREILNPAISRRPRLSSRRVPASPDCVVNNVGAMTTGGSRRVRVSSFTSCVVTRSRAYDPRTVTFRHASQHCAILRCGAQLCRETLLPGSSALAKLNVPPRFYPA